ncbi:MAG TPA: response regulator transcription factor [Actinomycetota bacterium]|nr:response regulator transcription factor [Actinomycetota bacterium]
MPRILLVEDDRGVREALRDLLTESDFDVVGEAGNGHEGVQLALELDPDVVLMDLRMPVMGGLEATRQIKDRRPGIRVVILTAYDDPALKEGAAESGVYAYLVKGCPPRLVGEVTLKAWEAKRSTEPPTATAPAPS